MNSLNLFEGRKSLAGKSWIYSKVNKKILNYLKEIFNINEMTATLVAKRVNDKSEYNNFLNPTLRNNLPNPYTLSGMSKSIDLVFKFIQQGCSIALLSDYDVDGATSAAIIYKYFKKLNLNLDVYIPDRLKEGYGISKKAIDYFESKNIKLLITLDCGTNEKDEIKYALKKNIEVIVIDHHEVKESTEASVLLNPKKISDNSNLSYLSTVGISFLFLVALNKKLQKENFFLSHTKPDLRYLLDLVALGTVCDLVPLSFINRLFVKKGIQIINKRTNLGLKILLEKINKNSDIESQDLGYYIGPCINAAGRIGKSNQGYNLLIAEDKIKAASIADELVKNNKERKIIESMAFNQAEEMIHTSKKKSEKVNYILVYHNSWHPGILGIVASRLTEKYQVPSFVISCISKFARGSVRSIKGINVNDILEYLKKNKIISTGGGHALAGGFEMSKVQLSKLEKYLTKKMKQFSNLENSNLYIDIISEIGKIDFNVIENLNKIAPYGMGNNEPRFLFKNLRISYLIQIGINKEHLSCFLEDIYGSRIKAILFNVNSTKYRLVMETKKNIHVVGMIKVNEWNKKKNIQLIIDDIMLL